MNPLTGTGRTSVDIGVSEVALHRAEMRMVRWMCGTKLQDRIPSKGLRERLGLDDIISVLQQNRLRLYGHVSVSTFAWNCLLPAEVQPHFLFLWARPHFHATCYFAHNCCTISLSLSVIYLYW